MRSEVGNTRQTRSAKQHLHTYGDAELIHTFAYMTWTSCAAISMMGPSVSTDGEVSIGGTAVGVVYSRSGGVERASCVICGHCLA